MQYLAPQNIQEASRLLARGGSRAYILNGGTDLLVRLRTGFIDPESIIDIKQLPGMRDIRCNKAGFRIGAAVTCAELNEHKELCEAWPGITEGAELIGSTQIQGRATMAGNLCNGSPAADSVPALIAAGATAEIASAKGTRKIKVSDIPTGPGRTSLKAGEFITAFHLSKPNAGQADAYLRFIPRTEMDIAVVGAAANITLNKNAVIEKARIVLGAVAPTVIEINTAMLVGSKAESAVLQQVEKAASAAAKPIDDKRGSREFRTQVIGVLARRAVKIAYARAKEKL